MLINSRERGTNLLRLLLFLAIPILGACTVQSSSASLSGLILLSPALNSKVGASDVLFVMALPPEAASPKGPLPPPIAVQKIAPAVFPVRFRLSQEDVPFPEKKLEGEVVLMARIDKDGEANPLQTGDLYGFSKKSSIRVGEKEIDIVIDKEKME